jgi:cytochrome oxidase Cu insertion factor (SCO1/SenC/PrrC family)
MSTQAVGLVRRLAIILALALLAVQALALWRAPMSAPAMTQSGTADIITAFSLTNQRGERITTQNYRGQFVVIYFGWSRDPDLTTAALQVLQSALLQLNSRVGRKSEHVVPLFISLDPQHDTAAVLANFVNGFGPNLSGATAGTVAATDALTRGFRLYVSRIPDPTLPGGYSVDHASLYYVLGKDGSFAGLVPYTTDSIELAREIQILTQ